MNDFISIVIDGITYEVTAAGNTLIVGADTGSGYEKHIVKVKESTDCTYDLKQKTMIKAIGGAKGLYEWLRKNTYEDDLFRCMVHKVIRHAYKIGK